MLVLTRKVGQSIIIGDVFDTEGVIRVTVSEIRGDRTRIAIEAPSRVAVNRHEVAEEIRRFGRSVRDTLGSIPYGKRTQQQRPVGPDRPAGLRDNREF